MSEHMTAEAMSMYVTAVRGLAGDLFTFGVPHETLDGAKDAVRAKWDGLPADRKQEVVVLFRSEAVFWIDSDGIPWTCARLNMADDTNAAERIGPICGRDLRTALVLLRAARMMAVQACPVTYGALAEQTSALEKRMREGGVEIPPREMSVDAARQTYRSFPR